MYLDWYSSTSLGRKKKDEASLHEKLDRLEGPKYAARRAELRRKAGEAARARDRQAAAASQDEADESDARTEEERVRVGEG